MATDGQKLTLGDTTVTMYLTPGHTIGTISSIFPVKDGGATHMAAYWGGTAFNWVRGPAVYITPERPARFWFDSYAKSAERFRDLASRAGADVVLSNHTKYDRSTTKLALVQKRAKGSVNPVRHRQGERAAVLHGGGGMRPCRRRDDELADPQ